MENNIKSITRIPYWQGFHAKYPDATRLQSIVENDPILTKIFNFCSIPSIFEDFKTFPFDEKRKEMQQISGEDIAHLADRRMRGGEDVEMLDYLSNLFDVVYRTVELKKLLDDHNTEDWPQEEILAVLEDLFVRFIAIDETVVIEEDDGSKTLRRRIGKYYPVMTLVLNEHYDKTSTGKKIHLAIHLGYPIDKNPDSEHLAWDIYSIMSFQQYRDIPGVSELTFDSRPADKVTIQYYYHNEPLFEKPFNFQTAKRYISLVKAAAGSVKDEQLMTDAGILPHDKLVEAQARFFELMLKYDPDKGRPGSFFKSYMDHFAHELYKKHSSQAGNIPCDPLCREEKELAGEWPCEHESSSGYCLDPKMKRRSRGRAERSGGRFDDPISDDGDDTFKDLLPAGEDMPIEGRIILKQIFETEQALKEILDKQRRREALTATERKRLQRIRDELCKHFNQ